jgi:PAS domain S-box-containing protein
VTTDKKDRGSREGEPPKALPDSTAALRESEERMRTLLSALPDLIFRIDRDGIFLDFHTPSPDMPALPSDRLIGMRIADVMPPETAQKSLRLIEETLRGGEVSPTFEYRLPIGGRATDFEARFARCGPDEVIAIVRDITEKKQTEETIRKNAERLRQVQKFEAIARMAGGLAHHLNNLMTVVTGYSELLLSRVPEADPRHGEIEKIRTAGERAAELTRQLLAFSRLQVLRPREVDVNLFISHLSTTLRNLAGRTVRFTFSPGDDVGTIQVDPNHLRGTLTHLVANAREAMPGGGELRVITTSVDQVEPIEGVEPARGRYALLTVRDSGCGMDAEARNRIFEPFSSLKSGREGMGLPSLYGFVKQSGGYIVVDSRPGDGTTFRIYFPCIDRTTDPGAGSESSLAGTPDAG